VNISSSEAREAENESCCQRHAFVHLLRPDDAKVTSPSRTIHIRNPMRAATDKSAVFDELLREHETQRLFSESFFILPDPKFKRWARLFLFPFWACPAWRRISCRRG
jgi:hypothetical protein